MNFPTSRILALLALLLSAPGQPLSAAARWQAADTVPKPPPSVKKPSALKKVVAKVADTLATVGAAKGVDALLGDKGKGISQMLGIGGANPCAATPGLGAGLIPGAAGLPTAGAKLVGIVKKAATEPGEDSVAAPPCPSPIPGLGAAAMQDPAAAAGLPGGMASTVMMATPLGMAVTAAPLAAAGAGAAAKGVKKLLGKGPMTAMGILKEVQGKGRVELRGVHFVAHTEIFDDGYEEPLSALAEALAQVPGPFALYVEPEADKGEEPDPGLVQKRVAKIWATLVAAGVPAKVFIDGVAVPDSLVRDRKPAKPGDAAIEVWKIKAAP